jgi:hypothetical protein
VRSVVNGNVVHFNWNLQALWKVTANKCVHMVSF